MILKNKTLTTMPFNILSLHDVAFLYFLIRPVTLYQLSRTVKMSPTAVVSL